MNKISAILRGFLRFFARPVVASVIALAVVAGLAAWGIIAVRSGPEPYRINAVFSSAPGIYSGNAVKVLGVRVGNVEKVTTTEQGVTVRMKINGETKVPKGVKAYLMAPNVVNDRFIELDPGYTGGSSLPPGTTLPVGQTVIPQSVDQIVASIDRLATELGPGGANADGSLSDLLHAIATTLGGDGGEINASVRNLGDTFAAVADNTDDLTSMLNDLGGVTHAAAGVSDQYQTLAGDLAQVSTTLANDDTQIASSIQNLARVLEALNNFVKDNKTQLAGTLTSLSKVAGTVGAKQQALSTSLQLLPLAVDNAGRTVQGGAIRTRVDPVKSPKMHRQICGDSLLRLLLISLAAQSDTDKTMDLACGTDQLLADLTVAPGAPDASAITRDAVQSKGAH